MGNHQPVNLEALVRGCPETQLGIVRSTGMHTVALFAIRGVGQDERVALAGTGTLFYFEGSHYLLTAAHVWTDVIRRSRTLGITLRENVDHRFFIDVATLTAFGPPAPPRWGEWGPDITFLRIPEEQIGTIEAFRVFYNFEAPPAPPQNVDRLQSRVLLGTPAEFGVFRDVHAAVEISGFFVSVDEQPEVRNGWDFLNFQMEQADGVPQCFGGVSGGGLWIVDMYFGQTGGVESVARLEGVAFWQSAIQQGRRTIRCHGPASIQTCVDGWLH